MTVNGMLTRFNDAELRNEKMKVSRAIIKYIYHIKKGNVRKCGDNEAISKFVGVTTRYLRDGFRNKTIVEANGWEVTRTLFDDD